MQEKYRSPQIKKITVSIINSTLLIGTALGFVTWLIGLINYTETLNNTSYFVDFFVISVLLIISIYRKQISIETKSVIIVIGLLLIVLNDVYKMGVYSDSKNFIIIIPFYSFLVYSLRKTIIIYSLVILSFLAIGYLYISGIIKTNIDFLERTSMINPWLINVFLLIIISFVVIVIMKRYGDAYRGLITDLEQNNKIISEQERNYREIFNSSTDAIFIHDLNGKILDVNDSMLKMYGYKRADIDNLDVGILSSGKDMYTPTDAKEYVKKAIQGTPQVFDWQAKKKNGEFFWVEVALKKINIAENDRILAVIRDINDKKEDALQLALYRNHLKKLVAQRTKELEQANEELHTTNNNLAQQKEELIAVVEELQVMQEKLIHSEKMASLGVLAAGVAHEINNPLNFIQGGLFGLENYFNEELNDHQENVKPLFSAINEGVKRASGIVTSLNHYSRTDNSKTEQCNIHKLIDDSLFMLHNKFKNKVEIKKEYTKTTFNILGNEGQLHQVIINLLLNAVQSIVKKGSITIRTEIEKFYLRIIIKDNGKGISKEDILKIFDPFFTTKEAGEGTGLGMSISLKIIKEHNGLIEYTSEIGKGTEATIILPIN